MNNYIPIEDFKPSEVKMNNTNPNQYYYFRSEAISDFILKLTGKSIIDAATILLYDKDPEISPEANPLWEYDNIDQPEYIIHNKEITPITFYIVITCLKCKEEDTPILFSLILYNELKIIYDVIPGIPETDFGPAIPGEKVLVTKIYSQHQAKFSMNKKANTILSFSFNPQSIPWKAEVFIDEDVKPMHVYEGTGKYTFEGKGQMYSNVTYILIISLQLKKAEDIPSDYSISIYANQKIEIPMVEVNKTTPFEYKETIERYAYLKLNSFKLQQDNAVSLWLEQEIPTLKTYIITAKTVIVKDSKTNIFEYFPNGENVGLLTVYPVNKQNVNIYFKRQHVIEGNEIEYLLIYLQLATVKFNLYNDVIIYPPKEVIEMDIGTGFKKEFMLLPHENTFLQIKGKEASMLYFQPNIQRIFIGSITDPSKANTDKLFLHTPESENDNLIIELCSDIEETIFIRLEPVNDKKVFPLKDINNQLVCNDNNQEYYLYDYSTDIVNLNWLNFNIINGQYEIFFKDSITQEDASLFPMTDEYKVNHGQKLTTEIRTIRIKSLFQGQMLMSYIREQSAISIDDYQDYYIPMINDKVFTVTIDTELVLSIINLEIRIASFINDKNAQVIILNQGSIDYLNNTSQYHRYESGTLNSPIIKIMATNEVLVSIKCSHANLFYPINSKTEEELRTQHLIFTFDNERALKYTIGIDKPYDKDKPLKYSIGKGKIGFVPLPSMIIEDMNTIEITNPFNKVGELEEAEVYYVTMTIPIEFYPYQISIIMKQLDDIEVFEPKAIKTIESGIKASLAYNRNPYKNKLAMYALNCNQAIAEYHLSYNNIDKEIIEGKTGKASIIGFNSQFLPYDFYYDMTDQSSGVTDISYNYLTSIEHDTISKIIEASYQFTYDQSKQVLQWSTPSDSITQFKVYFLKNQIPSSESNHCLIKGKDNVIKAITVDKTSLELTKEMIQYGNYNVIIIGSTTDGKSPLDYNIVYNKQRIKFVDPFIGGMLFWIWIGLGIAVSVIIIIGIVIIVINVRKKKEEDMGRLMSIDGNIILS